MTRLRLGLRDGLRVSPSPTGLLGRLVQQSVAANSDDANEVIGGGSDGVVSIAGTTIGFQSDRFGGFRFTPSVPQGARVLRAYIQFTSSSTIGAIGIAACTVTIWCQSADNAATFTTASKNITNRPKTGHSVGWNLPSSSGANAWLVRRPGPEPADAGSPARRSRRWSTAQAGRPVTVSCSCSTKPTAGSARGR